MTRVLLDTNVLVSLLTDRDLEQQAAATRLFEKAADGKLQLILHQAVITELVYVLGNLYAVEATKVAAILDDLLATPGIEPVDEVSWPRLLDLWPVRFADFGDAVLASVASEIPGAAIATFDQKFVRRLRREGLRDYWHEEA